MTSDAPDAGDLSVEHLTLGRLIEQLGGDIVRVLAARDDLASRIDDVTVHDPHEDLVTEPGAIVLAVGLHADDAALVELLRDAAAQDVTAVVVKARTEVPETAIRAAREHGVGLVSLTPQMNWGHLHGLIRSAIASAGAASDVSPGGVALGDLFALANAVAGMVGGAVSIEDQQSRVLAYSSLGAPLDEPRRETILGRRVPRTWISWLKDQGVFRALWSGPDVVRVPGREVEGEPSLRPRLAVSVWAGTEILGSMWVSEGDEAFTDDDVASLGQAARIAALHLVRHQAGDGLARRMRADLLRSVLEGRGPMDLLASQLGIEVHARYCVVAFDLRTDTDAEIALQQERALQLIGLYSEAMRRRAVCAVVGPRIYALLPQVDGANLDGVRRLVDQVVERGRTVLSVGLSVGIGSMVDHLRDVAVSRGHADQVLRVLAARADGDTIAAIDDVRSQALLLEFRDLIEEQPQFREGRLAVLVEHDADKDGDYVDTLRAYLRHFGDVPSAADALGVHPNTFRYRLKRLCEVAELNLQDPDERLLTELQLLLLV